MVPAWVHKVIFPAAATIMAVAAIRGWTLATLVTALVTGFYLGLLAAVVYFARFYDLHKREPPE